MEYNSARKKNKATDTCKVRVESQKRYGSKEVRLKGYMLCDSIYMTF